MKEIVEKLNLRMVYRFDYFECLGCRSQVVLGILLGIDRFKQKLHWVSGNLLPIDEPRCRLQAVDTALVLALAGHTWHHIAGQ